MTAQLALGTYRCRAIPEAVVRAAASGAGWVDTAPNYAIGRAQILLAPALAAHPSLNVSTKTGYFTAATGTDAVNDGVLDQDQAAAGHSLAPDYVRWQTGCNREQLRRDRLDLVLLHAMLAAPAEASLQRHPDHRPCPSRRRSLTHRVIKMAMAQGLASGWLDGQSSQSAEAKVTSLIAASPARVAFTSIWSPGGMGLPLGVKCSPKS
ncbi:hypothetical protein [Streptomyces sp. BK79]|uniref:hypothetical protein n=1 Tax=Streptomyces sp. BK79 TaxID=3350097 RepID=UPI00376F8444